MGEQSMCSRMELLSEPRSITTVRLVLDISKSLEMELLSLCLHLLMELTSMRVGTRLVCLLRCQHKNIFLSFALKTAPSFLKNIKIIESPSAFVETFLVLFILIRM